jgi:hypothetical protein
MSEPSWGIFTLDGTTSDDGTPRMEMSEFMTEADARAAMPAWAGKPGVREVALVEYHLERRSEGKCPMTVRATIYND